MQGGVIARPGGLQFQVRRQAGIMRHQFADGDQLFAVLLEFRPVIAHRGAEHNFALLHKLHHGRGGGHHFGHGGHVEDRVHGHRPPLWHQRAFAKGFSIDHLAVMADQDDGAGNFPGLNRRFHERSDFLQALLTQVGRGLGGRRRQDQYPKAPHHKMNWNPEPMNHTLLLPLVCRAIESLFAIYSRASLSMERRRKLTAYDLLRSSSVSS